MNHEKHNSARRGGYASRGDVKGRIETARNVLAHDERTLGERRELANEVPEEDRWRAEQYVAIAERWVRLRREDVEAWERVARGEAAFGEDRSREDSSKQGSLFQEASK